MDTAIINGYLQTTAFAGDNAGPQSAEEYAERKARLVDAANALGYDAEVKHVAAGLRRSHDTVVFVPEHEIFYVDSGHTHHQIIRDGDNVTGILEAESWVKAEAVEQSKAERDRKHIAGRPVVVTEAFVGDVNPLDPIANLKAEIDALNAKLNAKADA